MVFLRLFRIEINGLSPEERLVMTSFAMHFEGCEAIQLTVRDLSRRLGIPLRVVARAVSRLSDEKYVIINKVSVGRGRPSRSYKLSPVTQARLNEDFEISYPPLCVRVIKNLLSAPSVQRGKQDGEEPSIEAVGFKKPPSRNKGDQPRASNRWLLAVLFSYSDKLGVVRGVTTSQLRQMTGMGGVRLKSQLLQLVEQGLIRSYVPGASNTLFVGTKVSTTYFLNLNHPFLGLCGDASAVLALKEYGRDRRELVCTTARPIVALYLRGIEDQAFGVFCLRLDGYASFLLSNRWAELSNPRCPELIQSLEDTISADFQRSDGSASDGVGIDEANWAVVVEHIGWLALDRAIWIRKLLMRMPTGGTGNARIQIIPAPKQRGETRITTLLMERSPIPQANCLVINYTLPRVCRLYGEEAEISVNERYSFGLLTRPKG
jgi:hypothetical protein